MLHLLDFHEKLLSTLCQRTEGSPTTEHAQSLILDILCWLAGVYSHVSWRYSARLLATNTGGHAHIYTETVKHILGFQLQGRESRPAGQNPGSYQGHCAHVFL